MKRTKKNKRKYRIDKSESKDAVWKEMVRMDAIKHTYHAHFWISGAETVLYRP